MELFEQIRREHAYGVGTIQGVRRSWVFTGAWCAKHWRTQFPENERLRFERSRDWRPEVLIEAILEAEQTAARKQRHTAHRIWCRIRAEMPEVNVAESSIRRFVRERKIQLRLVAHTVVVGISDK